MVSSLNTKTGQFRSHVLSISLLARRRPQLGSCWRGLTKSWKKVVAACLLSCLWKRNKIIPEAVWAPWARLGNSTGVITGDRNRNRKKHSRYILRGMMEVILTYQCLGRAVICCPQLEQRYNPGGRGVGDMVWK